MADQSEIDLLREYADRNSEAAFAELVQQRINLVYSVALRYTGNSPDAQDVTQAVFIILAQKAGSLRERSNLAGWLYETTRLTARQLLRTRTRRQIREQEAYMQSTLENSGNEGAWRQLAPILEEAMSRLSESERTLLALRFFEGKTSAETAAILGLRESAAHKRFSRALEKLRRFFARRGVVLPVAILAGAISSHSVHAAPAALAKSITAVAVTKGAAASGSTLTLIKGTLKLMAWTKVKTAAITGIVLLLIVASGATISLSKAHSARKNLIATAYFSRSHTTDPQYHAVVAQLRAKAWPEERRAAEEKIKARQEMNDTINAVTVDLTPFINAALTDSTSTRQENSGNNLAELPLGFHVYGGVPFDVKGLIQLDGTNLLMLGRHYPVEVPGIPLGRKCARIHIFHGAHWVYRSNFGTTAAKLVLHYADGSAHEIEIVAGQHIFDFWSPLFTTGVDPANFKMAPGTEPAWTGSNPIKKNFWPDESLVLYKSTFDNPKPNVAISTVDYVSSVTGIAPFLVGLTTE